jgi:hypothetical protein
MVRLPSGFSILAVPFSIVVLLAASPPPRSITEGAENGFGRSGSSRRIEPVFTSRAI